MRKEFPKLPKNFSKQGEFEELIETIWLIWQDQYFDDSFLDLYGDIVDYEKTKLLDHEEIDKIIYYEIGSFWGFDSHLEQYSAFHLLESLSLSQDKSEIISQFIFYLHPDFFDVDELFIYEACNKKKHELTDHQLLWYNKGKRDFRKWMEEIKLTIFWDCPTEEQNNREIHNTDEYIFHNKKITNSPRDSLCMVCNKPFNLKNHLFKYRISLDKIKDSTQSEIEYKHYEKIQYDNKSLSSSSDSQIGEIPLFGYKYYYLENFIPAFIWMSLIAIYGHINDLFKFVNTPNVQLVYIICFIIPTYLVYWGICEMEKKKLFQGEFMSVLGQIIASFVLAAVGLVAVTIIWYPFFFIIGLFISS